MPGRHPIAGEWIGDDETLENMPVDDGPDRFPIGRPWYPDRAATAALARKAAALPESGAQVMLTEDIA